MTTSFVFVSLTGWRSFSASREKESSKRFKNANHCTQNCLNCTLIHFHFTVMLETFSKVSNVVTSWTSLWMGCLKLYY